MDKPESYGGGRAGSPYCKYCTDEQGDLLPRETVREKMVQFQMQSLGKTQEQAEKDVDQQMALMPAWQVVREQPTEPSAGPVEPPTPESTTAQPVTEKPAWEPSVREEVTLGPAAPVTGVGEPDQPTEPPVPESPVSEEPVEPEAETPVSEPTMPVEPTEPGTSPSTEPTEKKPVEPFRPEEKPPTE